MNVQTRRQFVVRAGTVAASAILSPSALAAGLGTARPAALARGGRFSEGVMSGEPTPSAITLWTRLADAEGRVSVDLEVATDKSFRHVVAHKRLPTPRAVNHAVKARDHRAEGPRAVLLPLRHGDQGRPGRALPDRAAGRLPAARALRLLVLPGLHPRLLQRPRGDGARGPRLRRLPRRLHLRRDLPHGQGRHRRPRRQGRPLPAASGQAGVNYSRAASTLADYRDKYSLYRSDASLRKVQQRFPTVMLWDDHEVQDNYAGGAPDGGLPPEPSLLQEAPGGRVQGVLRDDALLAARGGATASTGACSSGARSTC